MSTAAPAIEDSRRLLLSEIDRPPDLTVVRPPDGPDAESSWTGAQELLAERIYREVDLGGLCAARGHTVLLCAGGEAFCRPADLRITRALAVAELRFERVIVLPASFDPSEDAVRAALAGSRATFFARERESYRRIAPLCDARLAHDCALLRNPSLHVPELARESDPLPAAPPAPGPASRPRVSAIVVSHERPERALRAIDSLAGSAASVQTIVIDNNSSPAAAAALREGCIGREGVDWRRSDRNLGCAGGRRLAIDGAGTELVLLLDDDAELETGALDLLVAELDAHPRAVAVSATVALDDGTLHHSGGWISIEEDTVGFRLIGAGRPADRPLPASGGAGWVPGTAALIRRSVFDEFPIDPGMRSYFEDNEWCYRIERARPGSFRRSREARAIHHFTVKHGPGLDFQTRSLAVELLSAHAHFYARHGKLLGTALFDLVPELRDGHGAPDVGAARLLMELLLAKGTDWTFMEWMNGGLDVLLGWGQRTSALRAENTAQARLLAERDRMLAERREQFVFYRRRHETLERVENGGWWRLRSRVMPVFQLVRRPRSSDRR